MSDDSADRVPRPASAGPAGRARRRRFVVIALTVAILAVELAVGAPSLTAAVGQLRAPHWGWLAAAVASEIMSMSGYARMQRRLLRSAGTRVTIGRHVVLAYAAHSLSVSLPGGPLFSTRYNFRQMRRYGASAAVASWCIALSGILSSLALILIGAVGAIMVGGARSWSSLLTHVGVASALAVAVRAVARHPQWLIKPAGAAAAVVNRVRRRPVAQGREWVTALVAQLTAVRIRPADFALAGFFAIMNWLLDALCLWMCCRAVGAGHITTTGLVVAYCAGMAAASIPLVPGNLGVADGALVVGLVAGGLATSSAIAAVVLYRLISFGFIIAAGWLVWLLVRRIQRSDPADPARPSFSDRAGGAGGPDRMAGALLDRPR